MKYEIDFDHASPSDVTQQAVHILVSLGATFRERGVALRSLLIEVEHDASLLDTIRAQLHDQGT